MGNKSSAPSSPHWFLSQHQSSPIRKPPDRRQRATWSHSMLNLKQNLIHACGYAQDPTWFAFPVAGRLERALEPHAVTVS